MSFRNTCHTFSNHFRRNVLLSSKIRRTHYNLSSADILWKALVMDVNVLDHVQWMYGPSSGDFSTESKWYLCEVDHLRKVFWISIHKSDDGHVFGVHLQPCYIMAERNHNDSTGLFTDEFYSKHKWNIVIKYKNDVFRH